MGTIRGNMNTGRYGRMVVNTDGSVTLYNVVLENIYIVDCDLIAESGEYPIPFADRANVQDDWASQARDEGQRGNAPFYVTGEGGEEVQPGAKPTDLKAVRKAVAKADMADSLKVFNVEEVKQ
ncbi:MAG TPA: hypothetical protein VK788_06780 [Terriglobales bacterium]|jgi:hypothetical protein|nr:hypothetical protein [Terriglobales bacterium]